MSLFSKKPKAQRTSTLTLPSLTSQNLATIGRAAYGGSGPTRPGDSPSLVDPLVIEALESCGFPSAGTPGHDRLTDQFLTALAYTGNAAPPWGVVGAFLVAKNFLTDEGAAHETYIQLAGDALNAMRAQGVPSSSLPPYMHRLWSQLRPGVDW